MSSYTAVIQFEKISLLFVNIIHPLHIFIILKVSMRSLLSHLAKVNTSKLTLSGLIRSKVSK